MNASTLHCPNCGAPAAAEATSCAHCGSRRASVACPECFGAVFAGSRHCAHCGSALARAEPETLPPRRCPRCRAELAAVRVGAHRLRECAGCGGVWADAAVFARLCAERDVPAAAPSPPARPQAPNAPAPPVRYLPCPECGALMHRLNFARVSGVIVDACRAHGTWLDHDELRRIVEFLRAGGLARTREHEREKLREERARLVEQERRLRGLQREAFAAGEPPPGWGASQGGADDLLRLVGAAWRAWRC